MQRPIGVTLLAIGAGLAGLYQVWMILIYLGIVNFNMVGKEVAFPSAQWGAALWSLILAAIWFWVAAGFWNVRAYAWSFGSFIALFTLIWGFFALLFGTTYEAQTIPWLLAGGIYLYLNYPGVQKHFIDNELSRLTPEQRAAMEQLQAANLRAAQAGVPGAPAATIPTAATAPAAPPAAPPPPPAPPAG
ncbi:MAG TPA: hypothetical protein VH440_12185 [Candidatus Limnocylindrales bacterium]